jgi:hypothetical protein
MYLHNCIKNALCRIGLSAGGVRAMCSLGTELERAQSALTYARGDDRTLHAVVFTFCRRCSQRAEW